MQRSYSDLAATRSFRAVTIALCIVDVGIHRKYFIFVEKILLLYPHLLPTVFEPALLSSN